MNIAYLDPAYSRHFHRLAGTLARRTGGNAVALLSSPA
jgi:capsular polysaccharide export protein